MSDLIPVATEKRFYAAAASNQATEAFPSQEYYRCMRHRELSAYRMIVQCIMMHQQQQQTSSATSSSATNTNSDVTLTRNQIRLLEDLESELRIPEDRRDVEIKDASQDLSVQAVRESGVSNRRPIHFDGVNDVPIEATDESGFLPGDDTDDDNSIIAVGQKLIPSKTEKSSRVRGRGGQQGGQDSSSSRTASVGGNKPKNSADTTQQNVQQQEAVKLDNSTQSQLRKLCEQVPIVANNFVKTSDPVKRTQYEVELTRMKGQLEALRGKAVSLSSAAA